jgi:hypothetical protein
MTPELSDMLFLENFADEYCDETLGEGVMNISLVERLANIAGKETASKLYNKVGKQHCSELSLFQAYFSIQTWVTELSYEHDFADSVMERMFTPRFYYLALVSFITLYVMFAEDMSHGCYDSYKPKLRAWLDTNVMSLKP